MCYDENAKGSMYKVRMAVPTRPTSPSATSARLVRDIRTSYGCGWRHIAYAKDVCTVPAGQLHASPCPGSSNLIDSIVYQEDQGTDFPFFATSF